MNRYWTSTVLLAAVLLSLVFLPNGLVPVSTGEAPEPDGYTPDHPYDLLSMADPTSFEYVHNNERWNLDRLLQGRAAEETSGPVENRWDYKQSVESPITDNSQAEADRPQFDDHAQIGDDVKQPQLTMEHQSLIQGTQTVIPSSLQEHVQNWIDELAKTEEFAHWAGAAWDLYPLGPGTHGWVVIVRQDQEIGYLVVYATEDGSYRLEEYGTGDKPLFGWNTLYQSLVQLGLIDASLSPTEADQALRNAGYLLERVFVPPLQSVWEITAPSGETWYLDAKTGQQLPDLSAWVESLDPGEIGTWPNPADRYRPSAFIRETWEPEDPFLRAAWLREPPLEAMEYAKWVELARKKQSRLVYSARLFGDVALYPLAVSGYMAGPGLGAFVRLEHDGARYIAYDSAVTIGRFHS